MITLISRLPNKTSDTETESAEKPGCHGFMQSSEDTFKSTDSNTCIALH